MGKFEIGMLMLIILETVLLVVIVMGRKGTNVQKNSAGLQPQEVDMLKGSLDLEALKDKTHGLLSSVGELVTSTDEIDVSLKEITFSGNRLSSSAKEQLSHMREIKGFTEGIFHNVETNQESVSSVMDRSQSSYEKTMEKQQAIHQVVGEFVTVQSRMEKARETVSSLTSSTSEITNMMGEIRNIASQTNLLALNASIEAARAGDSGRGFAVVATEVRKLAEETDSVVNKITALIGGIDRMANEATTVMNTTIESIHEQSENLGGMIEDISLIANSIGQTLDSVRVLNHNNRELLRECEEVHELTEVMTEIIATSVESTEHVSQALMEEETSLKKLSELGQRFEVITEDFYSLQDFDKGQSNNLNNLTLATSPYPPYIIADGKGNISGIDIDIIREIFSRQGIQVTVNLASFDQSTRLVSKGYADLVPTLSKNATREKTMMFSDNYREPSRYVFVALCESEVSVTSFNDLKKVVVGTMKGFGYWSAFSQETSIKKDVSDKEEILFRKLYKRQIDCLIMNEHAARYYIASNKIGNRVKLLPYSYIDEGGSDTRIAFTKAKDMSHYIELFNEGYLAIKKDGTLKKIEDRYLY